MTTVAERDPPEPGAAVVGETLDDHEDYRVQLFAFRSLRFYFVESLRSDLAQAGRLGSSGIELMGFEKSE